MPGTARTGINPSRLDLGSPAAERDIKRGLADYFIESDAFRRVQRAEKMVILGNRGAGKSAIFQVLAQREREAGTHVIELAPEDYSYELLSRTMLAESQGSWAKLGAYAVAWKYLIYVLVMQELARKGPRLRKGPAADIYRYLRDNHVGGATSKLSALISYLKRLEGVKVGPYEASLRTRELEKLYKLSEIAPLFPNLRQVLQREKVVVLVDELDRGWDASEDAKAFVAGLFQACMSINELSEHLRVYMSLRKELYDNIPALYEDAQKLRDVIEVISWDEGSLLALIAARVRHSLPELQRADDRRAWELVFGRAVTQPPVRSFQFVVDRTLHRPREIIQFCAEAVAEARDRDVRLPGAGDLLPGVELRYSEERAKDIAAEYRFQYPGLLGVFDVFRGGGRHLDRDELALTCLEIATGPAVNRSASAWLEDLEPDALIEILWQVGFLQAEAAVGAVARRGGSFLGAYQVGNLNLHTIRRFRVHPMFWAYLGLKADHQPAARG